MIGAIKDIPASFYSHRFYSEVAHKRTGIGLGHMFVLTLLMFLAIAPWKIYTMSNAGIRYLATASNVEDWPDLTFKDSKLTINKPSPYFIRLGDDKIKFNIIIDPDYKLGDVNTLKNYMVQNNIFVIATADSMVTLKGNNRNELDIQKYGAIQDITIQHTVWRKVLDWLVNWGTITLFALFVPFYILFVFIANLIISLLTAVLVKLGSLICSSAVSYEACIRLVAAFRIPMSIICALPMLAGKPEVTGGAGWLVWLAYLGFVVYASKVESDIAA
jgi:hypothetical protein